MLTGCTSTPVVLDLPTYHPPLADPYISCEHVNWKYSTDGKVVRVSVSYQEAADLDLCTSSMIRYIKETNTIIKYYRENK